MAQTVHICVDSSPADDRTTPGVTTAAYRSEMAAIEGPGAVEFTMVVWAPGDDGAGTLQMLNQLGADGWSAVGLAPRAAAVPMAGMGASMVPEVVVLLQRPVRA